MSGRGRPLLAAAACLVPPGAFADVALAPSAAWVVVSTPQLVAEFDTLWAVSDVHGRLEPLKQLLVAAKLVAPDPENLRWNALARRQMLVVLGDCIDGGADSVAVVLLLERLQREAAGAGSRVVVLLGNHEAAFLADPGANATRELLSSSRRARLGPAQGMTPLELRDSEFGRYLGQLPVAAFIGSWLFAHGGYIDAEADPAALRAYLARVERDHAAGRWRSLAGLADDKSILTFHRWWAHPNRLARMRSSLQILGLNGVLIGHDPEALGAPRTIAMNRAGWLMKLDTGLKTMRTRGALLRCAVRDIVRDGELAMSAAGQPTCATLSSDAVGNIAVR